MSNEQILILTIEFATITFAVMLLVQMFTSYSPISFISFKIKYFLKIKGTKIFIFYGSVVVFLAIFMGVVFFAARNSIEKKTHVIAINPAGEIVSAALINGNTNVETTKGFYQVAGGFTAIKGAKVSIKTFADQHKQLCDDLTAVCKSLLN